MGNRSREPACWGALTVGATPRFSGAALNSPPLPLLDQLVEELAALAEHRPPVRPAIRRRLMQTASVGGARPKTTIRDDASTLWLVKPQILMDPADIPRLEHFAREWGAASGLDVAETVLHPGPGSRSVLRVRRFDRDDDRRFMCVSAASLLQAEYRDNPAHTDRWSYPRLAEVQGALRYRPGCRSRRCRPLRLHRPRRLRGVP